MAASWRVPVSRTSSARPSSRAAASSWSSTAPPILRPRVDGSTYMRLTSARVASSTRIAPQPTGLPPRSARTMTPFGGSTDSGSSVKWFAPGSGYIAASSSFSRNTRSTVAVSSSVVRETSSGSGVAAPKRNAYGDGPWRSRKSSRALPSLTSGIAPGATRQSAYCDVPSANHSRRRATKSRCAEL